MTPGDDDPWSKPHSRPEENPWSETKHRSQPRWAMPSFHWSFVDTATLAQSVVAIAFLALALFGLSAVLPDGDDCEGSRCRGLAPVAIFAASRSEDVAIEYLTCGTEYVRSVAVSNAVTDELLWTIQSERPTNRTTFVIGATPPAPYQELVPLEDQLSGRYTVSVLTERSHDAVFHTRDVPVEGVLYQGTAMDESEWKSQARQFGDCPFWNDSSGIGQTPKIAFGLLLVALISAALLASGAIKESPGAR